MRIRSRLPFAAALLLGVLACSAPRSTGAPPPAPASANTGAPASAASKPSAATAEPVVLAASQNVTPNLFVWLAHEHGLFEQHGVAVDLQSVNAIVAMKALVAGQLHGVVLGSPEVVSARASGAPLTIVAVFVSLFNQMMVAPPEIASPEQLRGRTVGVITNTSINGVGTVAGLRAFGLEPGRDYQLFESGIQGVYSGLATQLLQRNVDAAALEPGFARKVIAEGQRELFDQVAMGTPVAASSLTFQNDYLRANRDAVQRIVDTLMQSVAYAKANKADALAVLSKYFKIDDPIEQELTYARVVQQLYTDRPYPAPEQLTDVVEALARDQPDVRALDVSTMLDRGFVEDALRRGVGQAPARR